MHVRPSTVLRSLAAVTVAGGLAAVARRLLAERAPRRELDGSGPLLGSLDTWPPVPRATTGGNGGGGDGGDGRPATG